MAAGLLDTFEDIAHSGSTVHGVYGIGMDWRILGLQTAYC